MNHTRVNITGSTISCGIGELSRIGDDYEGVLMQILSQNYHESSGHPKAMYIWSNIADKDTHGHGFCSYLLDQKLGDVVKSPATLNSRTGNPIMMWTWIVNHEEAKKKYFALKTKKLEKAKELSRVSVV